jgi:hypothetical protein
VTAAQIRTAAELVADEPDDVVVSLIEIGSEGAVLRVGAWLDRGPRLLIARDGSVREA